MKEAPIIPVALVAIAVAVIMCEGESIQRAIISDGVKEVPVVNIPAKLRQGNWLRRGTKADGSCCHAAFISLLRWQGQARLADRWRRTHSGGETTWTMQQELEESGIPYAWHTGGDEKFLEWCIETRRGACIQYKDDPARFARLPRNKRCYHMVNVVHLSPKWVGILDNNDPRRVKWMDRASFMRNWRDSKGWAFTPVFSPAAPLPPHHRRETL